MEKVTACRSSSILGENRFYTLMNSLILLSLKSYQKEFLEISVSTGLIRADALALAGDGTPVVTSHRERKSVSVNAKRDNGITDCKCDRYFSQPDCDIGWDSSRTVIIMAMICTCLLIRKVTYQYFLILLCFKT